MGQPLPATVVTGEDPFSAAARAYLGYGIVYWIGGAYLAYHGIGIRGGGTIVWRGVLWIVVGLLLVVLVPYLLRRRRPWFERWILTRRDFARIVAVLMAVRALEVGRIALRPAGGAVPAPWGGEISFQLGAAVFFVVTVLALGLVARAAWAPEAEGCP